METYTPALTAEEMKRSNSFPDSVVGRIISRLGETSPLLLIVGPALIGGGTYFTYR